MIDGVRLARRAVQRVAVGVVAVADDAVIGGPVAIAIGGGWIDAFHRVIAGRARTGRPGAAIAVGGVYQAAAGVTQEERRAAVEQIAGVNAIGRDVADRGVVGALQEIKTGCGQNAAQGDVDTAIACGQRPAVEALGDLAGIEKLYPFIRCTGRCPAPGHLVDDHHLFTGRDGRLGRRRRQAARGDHEENDQQRQARCAPHREILLSAVFLADLAEAKPTDQNRPG